MLLPPADLLVPFLIAGVALNLTPGPDMAFVASVAGRHGWRLGVVAALGIFTGCTLHIVLAALGVAGLLAGARVLFVTLQYAGAAYLAYLAVGILRRPASSPSESATGQCARWRGQGAVHPVQVLGQGALVNALNPKVGLFFLAFLPQFVDSDRGDTMLQLLALGTISNVNGTLLNAAVAFVVGRAAQRLDLPTRLTTAVRWLAAAVLLAFALRMARFARS